MLASKHRARDERGRSGYIRDMSTPESSPAHSGTTPTSDNPREDARLTRQGLLDDFMQYGRPASDFLIGGEFERAVVRPDGRPVFYEDDDGIRWILEQIRARQDGWEGIYEGDALIALVRPNAANVTLEPGGQVELKRRVI